MCNFPLFLIIENLRNALFGTFTNVTASQSLSSTCRDTKCQPLFRHSLCEMLTSGNVNGQTTMRGSIFLEGKMYRSTVQSWAPSTEKSSCVLPHICDSYVIYIMNTTVKAKH